MKCRGLLIRGGDVLEAASQVDTVVFDKTGTLTQGRPCLQQVLPTPGTTLSAAHLLAYAAAVERCTTHPVAQAIVQAADNSGGQSRFGCPVCHCPHMSPTFLQLVCCKPHQKQLSIQQLQAVCQNSSKPVKTCQNCLCFSKQYIWCLHACEPPLHDIILCFCADA